MTPEEARAVMAARTEGPWVVQDPDEGLPEPHHIYIDTHAYEDGPYPVVAHGYRTPVADARAIALAVNTWDALMDVADAAREADTHHYESGRLNANGEPSEPLCGECGEDWPCPGDRLSGALAALAARLEAER